MAYANHSHVQANLLVCLFSCVLSFCFRLCQCENLSSTHTVTVLRRAATFVRTLFISPHFAPRDADESLCLNQDHLPLTDLLIPLV